MDNFADLPIKKREKKYNLIFRSLSNRVEVMIGRFFLAWVTPMAVLVAYTVLEYPFNADIRAWWPLGLALYAPAIALFAGLLVWLGRHWQIPAKVFALILVGMFVLLSLWLVTDTRFRNPTVNRFVCEWEAKRSAPPRLSAIPPGKQAELRDILNRQAPQVTLSQVQAFIGLQYCQPDNVEALEVALKLDEVLADSRQDAERRLLLLYWHRALFSKLKFIELSTAYVSRSDLLANLSVMQDAEDASLSGDEGRQAIYLITRMIAQLATDMPDKDYGADYMEAFASYLEKHQPCWEDNGSEAPFYFEEWLAARLRVEPAERLDGELYLSALHSSFPLEQAIILRVADEKGRQELRQKIRETAVIADSIRQAAQTPEYSSSDDVIRAVQVLDGHKSVPGL